MSSQTDTIRGQKWLPNDTELTSVRQTFLLICGGVGLFSAYIALVGSLGDELSQRITKALSFGIVGALILTAIGAVCVIALSAIAVRKIHNRPARYIVTIVTEVLIGLSAFFLLLVIYASGITVLQLSTGQFLLGSEEEQYRHLIILSAHAGSAFGVHAVWTGKKTYRLGWGRSFWHGAMVFVETAFIAYAGLWLFRDAFRLALDRLVFGDVGFVVVASLGMALICGGSLSLMGRRAHMGSRPAEADNDESANVLMLSWKRGFRTGISTAAQWWRVSKNAIINLLSSSSFFYKSATDAEGEPRK